MTKSATLKVLASIACLGFFSNMASAQQLISVEIDHSQMISIATNPGAVVIGNPSIADVSIQGDKMFIHGRTFGQTNLIVLDLEGNQILSYELSVKHVSSTALAVFRGDGAGVYGGGGVARFSYSCAPYCEAELQTGDQKGFFDDVLGQASAKTKFATGSETAEAKAPAAPQ